jgi:arylsulfatase A-like enzyme
MNRPNILFILTDQQRWDTTGVHGVPLDLTPNCDRMALEGTHFYNTFTCQPVGAPLRASLQTGMYATQAGVWRNRLTHDPDQPALARHFRGGYSQVGRALRTLRCKYSVVASGKDRWQQASSNHYVQEFLYDLQSDPNELYNLVGYSSQRKVADALRERLIQRIVQAGEERPYIESVPEILNSILNVHPEEIEQSGSGKNSSNAMESRASNEINSSD